MSGLPSGIWVIVGWMAFVILTAAVITYFAWRSGQFKDIEEAKYRMLEDREPEGWPGRDSSGPPRRRSSQRPGRESR